MIDLAYGGDMSIERKYNILPRPEYAEKRISSHEFWLAVDVPACYVSLQGDKMGIDARIFLLSLNDRRLWQYDEI